MTGIERGAEALQPLTEKQSKINLPENDILRTTCEVFYVHRKHGEDVARAEMLGGESPIIIICDGVGGKDNSKEFAEKFIGHALKNITNLYAENLDTLSFCSKLKSLLEDLNEVAKQLSSKHDGASTLLITLLYNSSHAQSDPYWITAGLGNGHVYILNDANQYFGQDLSPQQECGFTNAYPYKNFPAFVKMIPFNDGDWAFMATDGVDVVIPTIKEELKYTLAQYIFKHADLNLGDIFKNLVRDDGTNYGPPTYYDDATLAIITGT